MFTTILHVLLCSVQSSVKDEDGLSHILLCRVVLGRMELIHPGSERHEPHYAEFDSGVDDLVSPKKYIVWSTNMNTHILPELVISFRTHSFSNGEWLLVSIGSRIVETGSIRVYACIIKLDWQFLIVQVAKGSRFR